MAKEVVSSTGRVSHLSKAMDRGVAVERKTMGFSWSLEGDSVLWSGLWSALRIRCGSESVRSFVVE